MRLLKSSLFVATPAMHRVHHSRERAERDSNYSSVFSFWDRLASTFRLRRDVRGVSFGLDGYYADRWQEVPGLLRTPFTPLRP